MLSQCSTLLPPAKRLPWSLLACQSGDAHKRTLLCSTTGQAGHNLVPFSDDVLNREVQIRESRQIHVESLFDSLETTRRTRRGSVINVIGVDEFVDGSPILLVEHFIVETAYAGLVCFG